MSVKKNDSKIILRTFGLALLKRPHVSRVCGVGSKRVRFPHVGINFVQNTIGLPVLELLNSVNLLFWNSETGFRLEYYVPFIPI